MASDLPTSAAGPHVPIHAPPRVWTVFAVYVLGAMAAVGMQVAAAVGLAVWLTNQGHTAANLPRELLVMLTTPVVFLALILLSQSMVALTAALPARLSPQALRQRLGLLPSGLGPSGYVLVAVGSWFPTIIGLSFAYALALVLEPDPTVEMLYEQMTVGMALPFVLVIALAPGFAEELLFRGYMQRRLLERWRPWTAIVVTSLLFSLLHVMPHAIVFTFPLGIWMGYVAWRTGSVWPSIVCHAFVNGSWNVWQTGSQFADVPDAAHYAVGVVAGTAGLAAFVAAVRRLRRDPPAQEPVTAAEAADRGR